MSYVSTDYYGHQSPSSGTALTAGAVGTSAVGTIAPTSAAGLTPTVTGVVGTDMAGSFTLNPVTGTGAQAAGTVAQVMFAQPFAAVPAAVLVTVCDQAAGAGQVAVAASAQNITAAGFSVNVASALTTAHNYTVIYTVIP